MTSSPRISAFVTNSSCLCIAGIFLGFAPFCNNYYSFIIVGTCYGLFASGYAVTAPIILAEAFGLELLPITLGITMFFRGVGSSLVPIISGYIYDFTKTYSYACYLDGSIIFLGGVANELCHTFVLKEKKRQQMVTTVT